MEIYTLDRQFKKKDILEEFHSVIWTDRYYGDGDVKLIVPETQPLKEILYPGVCLSLKDSSEVMHIDTVEIKDKQIEITGSSLLRWFNNRFVRTSALHKDQSWELEPQPIGQVLWIMIKQMATDDSPYLTGDIDIAVPTEWLERLIVPELGLFDYDTSGDDIRVVVPFGPLYNAMREVATAYRVGMSLVLQADVDSVHPVGFRSYVGTDRTRFNPYGNAVVRFSPFWDSLANPRELQSNANEKNLVLAYAPQVATEPSRPGVSYQVGSPLSGFELRAMEIFVTDPDPSDMSIVNVLNNRAKIALTENPFVRLVDGTIVSTQQFQYERDFNLGDLVEIQGNSGYIATGRVTEYIRTQDASGETEAVGL